MRFILPLLLFVVACGRRAPDVVEDDTPLPDDDAGAPKDAAVEAARPAPVGYLDGGSCTKLNCDEVEAYFMNVVHICGKTADGCGGTQTCSRGCRVGACALRDETGTDFCNCELLPKLDQACGGDTPFGVLCVDGGAPTVGDRCSPIPSRTDPVFCCP